jgi:threonine synthase
MDIQLASNLERYLYFLYDENSEKLKNAIAELKAEGRINFSKQEIAKVQSEFLSASVDDNMAEDMIKTAYAEDGFVLDPHSACGVSAARKLNLPPERTICFGTAHPAKFPDVVFKALGNMPEEPNAIAALKNAPMRTTKLENSVEVLRERLVIML